MVFPDSTKKAPNVFIDVEPDPTKAIPQPSVVHKTPRAAQLFLRWFTPPDSTSNPVTIEDPIFVIVEFLPVLPVANFTANPTIGNPPLTVSFTDTSTGNPTEWNWDFKNDGIVDSIIQNPTYTYDTPGKYSVKLEVINVDGSNSVVKVDEIQVLTPPPVASFTHTGNGDAPLTVIFTDTSTGNPTSWLWDFGDGAPTSTLRNPTHVYSTVGTYSPKLTASNVGGSSVYTDTNGVVSTPNYCEYDPYYNDVSLLLHFDELGDAYWRFVEYLTNCGDSSFSNLSDFSKTVALQGSATWNSGMGDAQPGYYENSGKVSNVTGLYISTFNITSFTSFGIECSIWIDPATVITTPQCIMTFGTTATSRVAIYIESTNQLRIYCNGGSGTLNSTILPRGQWHRLRMGFNNYSSGSWDSGFFINNVNQGAFGSGALGIAYGSSTSLIFGNQYSSSAATAFIGRIDSMRCTVGTARLDTALALYPFQPFGMSRDWSLYKNKLGSAVSPLTQPSLSASGLFNNAFTIGGTAYVSVPYNTVLNFQNQEFWLEGWHVPNGVTSDSVIVTFGGSAGNVSWAMYRSSTGALAIYDYVLNANAMVTPTGIIGNLTPFRWAISRNSSGVTGIWLNGTLRVSATWNPPATDLTGIRIAINSSGNQGAQGLYDETRFTRRNRWPGVTTYPLATRPFCPVDPPPPVCEVDPYFSDVTLLLHFDELGDAWWNSVEYLSRGEDSTFNNLAPVSKTVLLNGAGTWNPAMGDGTAGYYENTNTTVANSGITITSFTLTPTSEIAVEMSIWIDSATSLTTPRCVFTYSNIRLYLENTYKLRLYYGNLDFIHTTVIGTNQWVRVRAIFTNSGANNWGSRLVINDVSQSGHGGGLGIVTGSGLVLTYGSAFGYTPSGANVWVGRLDNLRYSTSGGGRLVNPQIFPMPTYGYFRDFSNYSRFVTYSGAVPTLTTDYLFPPGAVNFPSAGYLLVASGPEFNLTNREVWLEGWMKPSSYAVQRVIIDFRGIGALNSSWGLYMTTSLALALYDGPSATSPLVSANNVLPTAGTGFRWAVGRVGTQTRLYVNGNLVASATYNFPAANQTSILIGADNTGGQTLAGSVDEIRFTNVNRWPSISYPLAKSPFCPTTIDANTCLLAGGSANSILLIHGNESNGSTTFTDFSPKRRLLTSGLGAVTSNVQKLFFDTSAYFDGDAYISFPFSSDFSFGTGDYDIQANVFITAWLGAKFRFLRYNDATQFDYTFEMTQTTLQFFGTLSGTDTKWDYSAPLNTWIPVRFTRRNGVMKSFAFGIARPVSSGSANNSTNITSTTSVITIGAGTTSTFPSPTAYLQDLIVLPLCLNDANYTPPTLPFCPLRT